jgi:acyl dehydratase
MQSRRFTSQDQIAFAELSGDYNPLHIDALAAGRMHVASLAVVERPLTTRFVETIRSKLKRRVEQQI